MYHFTSTITRSLCSANIRSQKLTFQILFSRNISSSLLAIELNTNQSKFEERPVKENLVFGTTPTDHMLTIEWNKTNKWSAPKIIPYQDLKISPAASSLHYGM